VPFWQIVLVAFALGLDAFAVAFAVGMKFHGFYHVLHLAASFGLFQLGMYVIGKLSGAVLAGMFSRYGTYLSAGILFGVGAHMIYSSFNPLHLREGNPTRGLQLILLSVATSLDALAVGFGFGILGRATLMPAIIIGLIAFAMTIIGMRLGKTFSSAVEKEAEILAGIILIFLGINMIL